MEILERTMSLDEKAWKAAKALFGAAQEMDFASRVDSTHARSRNQGRNASCGV
jgi:hypothetical protein